MSLAPIFYEKYEDGCFRSNLFPFTLVNTKEAEVTVKTQFIEILQKPNVSKLFFILQNIWFISHRTLNDPSQLLHRNLHLNDRIYAGFCEGK